MNEKLRNDVRRFHSTGLTNRQIAKATNVHHNTVGYHLKILGLKSNFANEPIDIVSSTEARCKKCTEIKPLIEFQYGRKGQKHEYRFSYCNGCRKKQVYLNINSDIKKFLTNSYNRLALRAAKLKVACTISKQEFIDQYNAQNGKCFYTDELLVCEVGNNKNRNSLSVDKIESAKGYVKGNLVFASNRINTCKSDLSLNEIAKWMPSWYLRIENFIRANNTVAPGDF